MSENVEEMEPGISNIQLIISVQIHRNNNSELSLGPSNRNSCKRMGGSSLPRQKKSQSQSHMKNIASTQISNFVSDSVPSMLQQFIQNRNSRSNRAQSSLLQQLQALDMFQATNSEDEVESGETNGPLESICLESDEYVK